MLVTLLDDIPPQASGTVGSRGGEWSAVWAGSSTGTKGVQYDVEIEIRPAVSEIRVYDSEPPAEGISIEDDRLMICGTVATVFDDGIAALNLEPGSFLIEIDDQRAAIHIGQVICVYPIEVVLYPTGI